MSIAGHDQYKRFMWLYDRFFKVLPWLWWISMACGVLLGVSGVRKIYDFDVEDILGVWFGTMIAGWLGFNGIGALWLTLLERGKLKSSRSWWSFFLVVFLVGSVFLYGFILFSIAIAKKLLAL